MARKTCDLGGIGGGLGIQSADGKSTDATPFDLGLTIDCRLQKMTVDRFLELAPIT